LNSEQILGVARILIPVLLSAFVGAGWLSRDDADSLGNALPGAVAAIATIGAVVWSILSHRQTSQIDRVAKMPEVEKVVVREPNIANVKLAANDKVVTE
jgi:hypothetical protein